MLLADRLQTRAAPDSPSTVPWPLETSPFESNLKATATFVIVGARFNWQTTGPFDSGLLRALVLSYTVSTPLYSKYLV